MAERILLIHTSTHDPKESSSAALVREGVGALRVLTPDAEVRFINAAKLKIAENLSCYAAGASHCADPKSGPYRCWAHVSSMKNNGWADEMPVIYDGLSWATTVIFSTSVRWGSHTAVLQRVIERMNTLENRGSAYGEPYPLRGKKLGVVVTGLHWKAAKVASDLLDTLRWWGFSTQPGMSNALVWQRTMDAEFEHPDNDKPYVERWEKTPTGQREVVRWAMAVTTGRMVTV